MTVRDPLLIACACLLTAPTGAHEWADRKAEENGGQHLARGRHVPRPEQ